KRAVLSDISLSTTLGTLHTVKAIGGSSGHSVQKRMRDGYILAYWWPRLSSNTLHKLPTYPSMSTILSATKAFKNRVSFKMSRRTRKGA
ncbi:hypothetical protein H0H93_005150, partial [Arthromyces matolae]